MQIICNTFRNLVTTQDTKKKNQKKSTHIKIKYIFVLTDLEMIIADTINLYNHQKYRFHISRTFFTP